ncbi:MAG: histone deacetylase family protein [Thermoplasmatota archaeon]
MVTLLSDARFLEHDPGVPHPEIAERLRAIDRGLEETGLAKRVKHARPTPASVELIRQVHTADHVALLESLAAAGGGAVDAETVMSRGSWDAIRLAAGAARDAARLALSGEPAFALARPPGHHATASKAMGFCFVNNVAVAADWAIREGGARRVAIFDHDVHHGNGTQDIFWRRADVLYVSIHQSPLYPGTGWVEDIGEGDGRGFTANFPVWPGTGESGYARVVDTLVVPILREFAPDLLLVSAGYDCHFLDPLANLRLGAEFFHPLYAKLSQVTPRVAAVLEGGYNLDGLSRSVASSVASLAGLPAPEWNEAVPRGEPIDALLPEFRAAQRESWTI